MPSRRFVKRAVKQFKLQAKKNWKALQKRERLEIAHRQILTPRVLRATKLITDSDIRKFIALWIRTKKVDFLPEGIPFKVTNDKWLCSRGSTVVLGRINKPIILVPSYLSAAERIDAARHELIEWQRAQRYYSSSLLDPKLWAAHAAARIRQNPGLRASMELKRFRFLNRIRRPRKKKRN